MTQLTTARGKLYRKGKPVDAKPAKEALKSFVEWLETNKQKKEPVVLVAHNAKIFDCQRIIFSLKKYIFSSFEKCVVGLTDTLILFKNKICHKGRNILKKFVSDLLGISYGAHDSLEDVRDLQKIVSYREVNEKTL